MSPQKEQAMVIVVILNQRNYVKFG